MTIRFRLWQHYKNKEGKCALQLVISDKGKEKTVKTGIRVDPEFWDQENQKLKSGYPLYKKINLELWNIRLVYEQAALKAVMNGGDTNDLLKIVSGASDDRNFISFGKSQVIHLKSMGKDGTAIAYKHAINQLDKSYPEIRFQDLTPEVLKEWRDMKIAMGMAPSGVHSYLRSLRAIWNKSDTEMPSPFIKGLFPKITTRMPRNNSVEDIKALFRYRPGEKNTGAKLARDLWCLGFLFRGMDFVDLSKLRVEELQSDYFMYQRQKTREELKIRIFPEARIIINDWSKTGYLFPIRQGKGGEERSYIEIKNQLSRVNRALVKISNEVQVGVKLTTKTCRYSFASIAKDAGIDFSVIREMLGHKERGVTALYLDRHPQKNIDDAHKTVFSKVCT